jgi:hypothetical protein
MSAIKVFKVTIESTPLRRPYWVHVEALSFADAIARTKKVYHDRSVTAVEDCPMYGVIAMDDRERAEIEAEAKRIGLGDE